MQAAKILIAEGLLDAKDVPSGTDGYREPTSDFIDGLTYDGKRPLEYLKSHTIGNKD